VLVSTSHNFVFVHIAKNGGTTLRNLLQPYAVNSPRRSRFTDAVAALPLRQRPERIAYPPHRNARWARRKLGAAFFDHAFSFAFVRNPNDRAVSRYEYVKQNPQHHDHHRFESMSFARFIADERLRNLLHSRSQFSEVTDRKGKVLVSKLYRLEEFDQALPDICARIGIDAPPTPPIANRSSRNHYQAYFTPELKTKFDRIYRIDLEYFGYEF